MSSNDDRASDSSENTAESATTSHVSDTNSDSSLLYETVTSHSLAYEDEPLAEPGENDENVNPDPDGILPEILEQRSDGRIPVNQW